MRLIDPTHPFFRPAWRRYLVTLAPFAWATIEYALGNTVWAYLFAGIGGYVAWLLIFSYKEPDP